MNGLRPISVLVVDDDPEVASAIVELLACNGFKTAGATSGEEALQLAIADPPDIALVDRTMPGMNGKELAIRLRRTVLHSPLLILMTEIGEELDSVLACNAGFHLRLTKPIASDNLLSVLDICARVKGDHTTVDEGLSTPLAATAPHRRQPPAVVQQITP